MKAISALRYDRISALDWSSYREHASWSRRAGSSRTAPTSEAASWSAVTVIRRAPLLRAPHRGLLAVGALGARQLGECQLDHVGQLLLLLAFRRCFARS